MRKLLWLFVLFTPFLTLAQTSKLDSLLSATNSPTKDTTQVFNFLKLSNFSRVEEINYTRASEYANKALTLSKEINFKQGIFKSSIALGYVERDMGNRVNAINFLENGIQYFESNKLGNEHLELIPNFISTHTALANIFANVPDFELAQKYAYKALSKADEFKVSKGQSLLVLSIIFSKQKNLKEAKINALKALEDFEENNAFDDLARTYAYLARYAYQEENYQNAIGFYLKSYQNYKKVKSTYGQRIALYNLASSYLKLADFEKADDYAQQALSITGKNDLVGLFYLTQLRAELAHSQKKYADALTLSKKALEFAINVKSKSQQVEAYNTMLTSYLAIKDTGNSFLVSQKILVLKDSLYSIELAKNTAELAKKYDLKSKEQKIEFLDKENLIMKETSKNDKIIEWVMGFGILSLFLASFFYYQNFRKQKKANVKINKQSEQVKTLMNELHHRVKNNIQYMISILNMQARATNNDEAKSALVNSENRLKSIALVHDKLYATNKLRSVKLKHYLNDLLKDLTNQHKGDLNEFNFSIEDDKNVSVSLAVAVPFGLIINELVTNSFKYSFKNVDTGSVQIKLSKDTANNFLFSYRDSGPGFDVASAKNSPNKLGLKLIDLLVEQLNGTTKYDLSQGLLFTIQFSNQE